MGGRGVKEVSSTTVCPDSEFDVSIDLILETGEDGRVRAVVEEEDDCGDGGRATCVDAIATLMSEGAKARIVHSRRTGGRSNVSI